MKLIKFCLIVVRGPNLEVGEGWAVVTFWLREDFDVQPPRSRLGLEWRKAPPTGPQNCYEGLSSDRRCGTIGRRE